MSVSLLQVDIFHLFTCDSTATFTAAGRYTREDRCTSASDRAHPRPFFTARLHNELSRLAIVKKRVVFGRSRPELFLARICRLWRALGGCGAFELESRSTRKGCATARPRTEQIPALVNCWWIDVRTAVGKVQDHPHYSGDQLVQGCVQQARLTCCVQKTPSRWKKLIIASRRKTRRVFLFLSLFLRSSLRFRTPCSSSGEFATSSSTCSAMAATLNETRTTLCPVALASRL